MFSFDSKHTRTGYKIRAQEQEETFGVVNRRQFGGNYIPMISFHSQAPHVQGHFEIWKQVFTHRVTVVRNIKYLLSLELRRGSIAPYVHMASLAREE